MKAVKPSQPEDSSIPPLSAKVKCLKQPFIRHFTALKDNFECQMYSKRNYMSHHIAYSANKMDTPFDQILKRNSKYIRTLKPYLKGFNPRLDIIKQLKSLKTLDLLMDDNLSLKSWMTPQEARYFMKVILRSGVMDEVRITPWMLEYCQRSNFRKIEFVKSLWIKHPGYSYSVDGNRAETLLNDLPGLCELRYLTSVTVDFRACMVNRNLLHEVFIALSDLENLRFLRVFISVELVDKEPAKINKKVMDKFNNLLSLHLWLHFGRNPDCGLYLTKILPLKNLQNLRLDIYSSEAQISSDIPDFISSLKNLKHFNLSYNEFLHCPHEVIFKSLQKLKKLEKISVLQMKTFSSSLLYFYPFEHVNKTIQLLQGLKQIEIDVGDNFQKPRDFYPFFNFLVNHKSLEEVKTRIALDKTQIEEYPLGENFYKQISSLINKLKVFKLILKDFPEDVFGRVVQMFSDAKKDPKSHSCMVYATPKYPLYLMFAANEFRFI